MLKSILKPKATLPSSTTTASTRPIAPAPPSVVYLAAYRAVPVLYQTIPSRTERIARRHQRGKMAARWLDADVEKFLEDVRQHPTLYDRRDPDYKNDKKRTRLWMEISLRYGRTVEGVISKFKGLKDTYKKKKKRLAADETYKEQWKYYDVMHELLGNNKRPISAKQDNDMVDGGDDDQFDMTDCNNDHLELSDAAQTEIADKSISSLPNLESIMVTEGIGESVSSSKRKKNEEGMALRNYQVAQAKTMEAFAGDLHLLNGPGRKDEEEDIEGFVKIARAGLKKIPVELRGDMICSLLQMINNTVKQCRKTSKLRK